MKKLVLLTASVLCFSFAFVTLSAQTVKFTAGMKVAAKWSDGEYYLAKITKITDGQFDVDYEDGSQGTVAETDLKIVPAKPKLAKGDKVLAVWSGSKFYPGTVTEVKPKGAIIQWDDGSAASMVEYGKIIKE